MEFRMITPLDIILPEVQWNHEELKAQVIVKSEEYNKIAYTDDDVKAMKEDRAVLNKFIKAVEEERKRVKAYYLAPYETFEAQVKEVLMPVNQAIQALDKKIEEAEEKYREEKKQLLLKYYERHVGDLKEIIPFDKTVREEFFKKSFTTKKLEQAYMDFFGRVREDRKVLDELDSKYKDRAMLEYMKSFSLTDALREGRRMEELAAAIEQSKKKEELELAEQTERIQAMTEQTQEKTAIEAVLSLDFRVWGTREQLMDLKQYMVQNQIKFGKVE